MNLNTYLLDLLWTAINTVKRWHLRRTAIGTLTEMNDYMLKDIGIQRSDIPLVVADKLKTQRVEGDDSSVTAQRGEAARQIALSR